MTAAKSLKWAMEYLSSCKVPMSHVEAVHLISHVLGCQRKDLLVYPDRVLTSNEMERFKAYVYRRGKREPLQYIIGEVEFRGLLFKVNKDVLIPRPETELLVEDAVKSVGSNSDITVLDLCTGSGCIAICVAKELNEGLMVYAVDISAGAIEVAKENAGRHGVEDRITFLVGDLFSPLEPLNLKRRVDIIVSNPPYVSKREMEELQPEIKEYEPASALYGGEDGLDFYRRIIHGAPVYLAYGGLLIMEIGYGQAERVKGLFGKKGDFRMLEVKKDLAGIDRVIKATYTG